MRTSVAVQLLLAGWGPLIGCAPAGSGAVRPIANGHYQLECEGSLRECLTRAEEKCDVLGYRVLAASEAKRRVGVPPLQSEYANSRATFACGVEEREQVATGPASASLPVSPAAPHTCLPGASQACVGPGGCSGGQSCMPNGRALSPCDCGERPLPQQ